MNIQKWAGRAVAAAGVAALLAGGCDGGGDAAVSRNSAAVRAGPPDFAAPVADGPGDAGGAGDLAMDVEDGRELYAGSCAACHGTGGQGLPNQGPDLRGSEFVAGSTDDQLLAFLASGRPAGDPRNKSGLPMPPRGGNPSLTDRHLGQIVKYLRVVTAADDVAQFGSAAELSDGEGRP
jgi:disulfide bond formation protein DsbB